MNSLVVFDINSLYQSCRNKYNGKTDFAKLLTAINQQTNIVMSTGYILDKNNDCQKFINALTLMGINVQRCDSQVDVAVAIATDIARFTSKVHCVYLCSGDINNYKHIVSFAKNHGVNVLNVGYNLTSQGWELDENYLVEATNAQTIYTAKAAE